jgi:hypothetical protein
MGERHGSEAPAQQLVIWGAVTESSPSDAQPDALEVEAGPEPGPVEARVPGARRPREEACEGCEKPWTEVSLFARVEAGWLCDTCYDRVLREALAEEDRRVARLAAAWTRSAPAAVKGRGGKPGAAGVRR